MDAEIRYCTTSDGVRIAYSVEGGGHPLLWCPIFVESISLTNKVDAYRELASELTRRWTLIRYDPRGVRLSQGSSKEQTNEALVRDMEAVVAAVGVDTLAIWANTLSGPRAISYAVKYAHQVSHLILYDTFANPSSFPRETATALAGMARTNWRLVAEMASDLDRFLGGKGAGTSFPEMSDQLARLWEQSSSGDVGADMLTETYENWDVRGLLPSVECDTLVIHHLGNNIFPIDEGKMMAAEIPNARLTTLDGPYSTPVEGILAGDDIVARLERFLPVQNQEVADDSRSPVQTVLFTDLVGHAELMSHLGDQRGREFLREHESITRDALRQHHGTEVKAMGDGFMASFGSVTNAVECAITLQREFAQRGDKLPPVRVGLNAGEPVVEDGDLFGATVILASRIAAKADGGEILVADTVRGLCSGKGFLFSDRGDFVAKGFEEPVRIHEVNWRTSE